MTFICTDVRVAPVSFLFNFYHVWLSFGGFSALRKKVEIQDGGDGGSKKTVGNNGVLIFSVILRNSLVL